jgi:hypothetical protein
MRDSHAGTIKTQLLGDLTAGQALENPLNPAWRRGVGPNVHQAG